MLKLISYVYGDSCGTDKKLEQQYLKRLVEKHFWCDTNNNNNDEVQNENNKQAEDKSDDTMQGELSWGGGGSTSKIWGEVP